MATNPGRPEFKRVTRRVRGSVTARAAVRLRRLTLESLEDRSLLSAAPLSPAAAEWSSLAVDYQDYDASRILVRFADANSLVPVAGTQLGRSYPLISGLREVLVPEGLSIDEALAAYRGQSNVLYAQPNYRLRLALTPNDPKFTDGTLWGMHNTGQSSGTSDADIDAPEAWDITTGSSSVIVAVIDTGVDYNHADLAANMWRNPLDPIDGVDNDGNGFVDDHYGADFVNNDGDPMDDHYHGTHVAGTIGGVGNNGAGIVGVAWNVRIMALKFLDAGGYGTTINAIAALNYAVAHGAKISNHSYGGGPFEQSMLDALQAAAQQGHLVVAAAGNGTVFGTPINNDSTPFYPSSYQTSPDSLIAVAATNRNDKFASWSNYGATSVDLAAPGVSIYSASPGNSYQSLGGTSMASPHVAGTAALVWSADPTLTASQVKQRILDGTDYVGDKNPTRPTLTNGRLNAHKAIGGSGGGGGNVTLSITDVSVDEGNSGTVNAVFTVNLSQAAPAGGVSVQYATANGTAIAEGDYASTAGTLTISEGATSGTISVQVVGDTMVEPNETFFVNLSNASGATIQDAQGLGTIVNDDSDASTIGSDAVYAARVEPFQNIDLVPGASGVTTLLRNGDNSSANVGIGTNTFNFYGTQYSSFYMSTNGLITFGSSNTSNANTDLTSSPTQRLIAPLWDDWRSTSGNSILLGRYQDVDGNGTNEVVLEWNKVQGYSSSPSTVTFQVILWLNTGSTPGDFAFNYPDLDAGNSRTDGGSATVGIKDSGAQGSRRILISYNTTGPYVSSGKAIRFSPITGAAGSSVAAAGESDSTIVTILPPVPSRPGGRTASRLVAAGSPAALGAAAAAPSVQPHAARPLDARAADDLFRALGSRSASLEPLLGLLVDDQGL